MFHPCKTRAAALIAALLGLASLAQAQVWQAVESIGAAAEEAVRARLADSPGEITVAAEAIDARLRFPVCGEALVGTVPALARETARITTEVRCAGNRGWRLFVPVRVSARRLVAVAAVPLERGKVLAAGDVILAQRDVGALAGGYVTGVDGAIGRSLRRPLPAGAALTPSLLAAPLLVRRGQPVTLEARSGAITVQMAGIARDDGALGQTIAVENPSSKRILQGVVRNEKSVQISLP